MGADCIPNDPPGIPGTGIMAAGLASRGCHGLSLVGVPVPRPVRVPMLSVVRPQREEEQRKEEERRRALEERKRWERERMEEERREAAERELRFREKERMIEEQR